MTLFNRFRKTVFIIKMRWKYNDCHSTARKIAAMGQDNLGQYHLDAAKDSLYKAAIIFDNEAKS